MLYSQPPGLIKERLDAQPTEQKEDLEALAQQELMKAAKIIEEAAKQVQRIPLEPSLACFSHVAHYNSFKTAIKRQSGEKASFSSSWKNRSFWSHHRCSSVHRRSSPAPHCCSEPGSERTCGKGTIRYSWHRCYSNFSLFFPTKGKTAQFCPIVQN